MKTFLSEGKEITVPDISFVEKQGDDMIFQINEGEHKGIQFSFGEMRVDDQDESLLWYDLKTTQPEHVDLIKETVDNFILMILYEQIGRLKNEQVSEERDTDTGRDDSGVTPSA